VLLLLLLLLSRRCVHSDDFDSWLGLIGTCADALSRTESNEIIRACFPYIRHVGA